MHLDSYLEIFTTLYGWMFYGLIWDVLVATGIVYLPFFGILIDNWKDAAQDGDMAASAGGSLRRLEIDVFLALLVVVLAAQPAQLTAINAGTLNYTPVPTLNTPSPTPIDLSNNDSSFGHAGFNDPDGTVPAPAWWFAVLSFASGFNHAVIEGIPRMSEIRQVVHLARLATIRSPLIRQETAAFYNDCYMPARSKFFREKPNDASIVGILNHYGEADVDWVGSHVYRDTVGYYDTYRAISPVQGWSYQPSRDTEYDASSPPAHGRPYCKEWWEHSHNGLRAKLIVSADASAAGYSGLVAVLGLPSASEEHLDVIARTTLLNAPSTWSNNALEDGNRATTGVVGWFEGTTKRAVSAAGIAMTAAITGIIVTVLLQLLPFVQALVLMSIYALLPLLLVLSRYSLSTVIGTGILIFSIKFWTVLWYLAQWVDQNLIISMYPDVNVLFEVFVLNGEQQEKRILLNIVTTLLYVGLPILWTAMVGWAGVSVARSMDSIASPLTGSAQDAGRRGMSFANSVTRAIKPR